ncbi:hypothetical protein WJX72_005015 [[Myrmecia] bisecta]|uniref:von Hippel-Lindau disease tumour suppressor beta domain-containing protein n=1 Tax=[Myrmecia] bisecta TaxID=41462 RepID=A0AAW1Q3I9_9CHLO
MDVGEEAPQALQTPLHTTDGLLIRSRNCRRETYLNFVNHTPYSVKLLWLTYQGQEKLYQYLAPRQEWRQQTFCTHPWTFRASLGEGEEFTATVVVDDYPVYYPRRGHTFGNPQPVHLRMPTVFDWSHATHREHAPRRFQAAVKALLLCHHRLQGEQDRLAKETEAPAGRFTRGRTAKRAKLEQARTDACERSLGALPKDLVALLCGASSA